MDPAFPDVHDRLGEAYMKSGDRWNGRRHHEKSLEVNPENTNAKEMLKKLKKK